MLHFIKIRNKSLDSVGSTFKELYADLRDSKIAKLYNSLYLVRRTIIVVVILLPSEVPVIFKAIV